MNFILLSFPFLLILSAILVLLCHVPKRKASPDHRRFFLSLFLGFLSTFILTWVFLSLRPSSLNYEEGFGEIGFEGTFWLAIYIPSITQFVLVPVNTWIFWMLLPSGKLRRFSLTTLLGVAIWITSLFGLIIDSNPWVAAETIRLSKNNAFHYLNAQKEFSIIAPDGERSVRKVYNGVAIDDFSSNTTLSTIKINRSPVDARFKNNNTIHIIFESPPNLLRPTRSLAELFKSPTSIGIIKLNRIRPERWYGAFYRIEVWFFLSISSFLAFRTIWWWRKSKRISAEFEG